MHDIDPHIPVSESIHFAGSQANLSRLLGVSKSSVNEWVSSERDFVPPLQGWRLWRMSPGRFNRFLPDLADVPNLNIHPLNLTA